MDQTPRRVVIFGNGPFAEMVHTLITHDSPHDVVGFTADAAYVQSPTLAGLPVVAFEKITDHFAPEDHTLFAPLGFQKLNALRAEKAAAAKALGYASMSYVASTATLWPNVKVGDNVMIAEQVVLQPYVEVGDNVIIRSGSLISHHTRIAENAFIASGVTVGGSTTVGARSFLGMGTRVGEGLTLAPRTALAAGSVLLSDTTENGLYAGAPARLKTKPADVALQ